MNKLVLEKLAKQVRHSILISTTHAGSGHPSSSLSAADLMTVLYFGGFLKYDLANPQYHNNDRVIFSKGHAAPLLYALYAAAGKVTTQELKTLRRFNSRLEGHPTSAFPYSEAATGSLGQGLSIGVGMALNAKIDRLSYKTYVLLGDSEMAEGSVWEAIQLAAYYKLDNLIGIIDVNRLGQRGQTMYGHNVSAFANRVSSFGWQVITVDGHSVAEIAKAYQRAAKAKNRPVMIIAKTIKGKGVRLIENKNGWHGKTLSVDELQQALLELGTVDFKLRGKISLPKRVNLRSKTIKPKLIIEEYHRPLATRKAYGHALVKLYPKFPQLVVLDAEVSNSTYAQTFKEAYPDRFFEMFIAEQNMVGVAVGLAARGKIPFISTFAAFFTRAFDQIRMAQYSGAGSHINFVGSHAGTSIGEDGSSQMGLEDISMFRSVLDSIVLYPCDHVSDEKLVEAAIKHPGICYVRTTRSDLANIYPSSEKFEVGGSKTVRHSSHDQLTVVAAGITLHEALAAYEELRRENITIRVVDVYSVKPIDVVTLKKCARETSAIIVVEDHFEQGGIGEAVRTALQDVKVIIHSLAVRKMPKSGRPEQLLSYEEIDRKAIIKKVKQIIGRQ
ncbi:MAG: transketolase [Candidatus Buchananbacteria bacterium]|nr:transketolase [Candidatus Buchananbacteria bacterium]